MGPAAELPWLHESCALLAHTHRTLIASPPPLAGGGLGRGHTTRFVLTWRHPTPPLPRKRGREQTDSLHRPQCLTCSEKWRSRGAHAALVNASTMPSTTSSTSTLSSPSPMTRITGSVPDERTISRPWPSRRACASSMALRTL